MAIVSAVNVDECGAWQVLRLASQLETPEAAAALRDLNLAALHAAQGQDWGSALEAAEQMVEDLDDLDRLLGGDPAEVRLSIHGSSGNSTAVLVHCTRMDPRSASADWA